MITPIHPKKGNTLGPYSPAILFDPSKGKLLFVSGQLPINHETGIKIDSDIRAATRLTLQNIGALLEAAGSSFLQVLRVDVFLQDMEDFAAMNEVYAEFFKEGHYPARQTTQSSIHALLEISCIAAVPIS